MPAAIQWTEDIKDALIDGIVAGEPICKLLKTVGVGEKTFYRYRLDNPEFDSTIARAQEFAQEAFVDSIEALIPSINAENFNAVKTQMWARMWIAGKRKAKKYGDNQRVALTDPEGNALQIVVKSILDKE